MAKAAALQKRKSSPWGDTRRKRENQFAEKRDVLFDTAARLFRERGFDNTSLSELADILKITKPTVYYYVKSKDDLIYKIKCIGQEKVLSFMTGAAAMPGSGYEKLRRAMIDYGEFMTTDYGVCLSIVPARHMEPENRESFYRGVTEANEALARIIEGGIADGSLRVSDSSLAIRALFGSLNWIGYWYRVSGPLPPRKLAEQQVDMLLDGIRV